MNLIHHQAKRMSQHLTQQEWLTLIREFYNSDLSSSEFCSRHDINVKTFGNNRRKLQSQLTPPDEVSFIEVKKPSADEHLAPIVEQTKAQECLRLDAGACQLHIPMSAHPQWIAQLIREVAK